RNREPLEDPGESGGHTVTGVARRDPNNEAGIDADGGSGEPAADPHGSATLGPNRRIAFPRIGAPVDLPDDLEPLPHRTRDGESVGQHVVLPIASDRVRQDTETGVSDEPDRLHGLADEGD